MMLSEERRKVLQMVEEGKLSPEDGARLLSALGQVDESEEDVTPAATPGAGMNGRYFRVRVTNVITGKQKVTVNIPLGLVEFGLRFVPENDKFDPEMLRQAIRDGLTGRIVEVLDDEKGERVEIFIE
ncbi:MAG: SHOCT-like domain-containing protein [Caldilinea sp.]